MQNVDSRHQGGRGDPSVTSVPGRDSMTAVRKLLVAALAVVVLAAVAVTGIGWYFAGQVLAVQPASHPLTVSAVDAGTVTLTRAAYLAGPGRYGLFWDGGHARVGEVVRTD